MTTCYHCTVPAVISENRRGLKVWRCGICDAREQAQQVREVAAAEREWGRVEMQEPKPLTFGSLFAGIGGIDLGLERSGMTCKWQVEIDDYATKVLAKHWPDVHRERDVRACGKHNLEAVDLIAGGFPCQDISSAGKRAGLAGERSGLWYEFARIVGELRPRYVLVENVAALLSPIRENGRIIAPAPIGTVLGDLVKIGYDAEWQCISAAAVGAPHIRDRVFILAYTNSSQWWSKSKTGNEPNGNDARWQEKASRFAIRGETDRAQIVANTNRTRLSSRHESGSIAAEDGAIFSRRELERACATSGRQQWAVEPSMGRVAHGIPRRVDRLRGLGNAVVPQVAEFVGRSIVEHAMSAAN